MTDLVTMLIRDDRIEVAKNALRKGFSITDVADITGVDESTIRQLQEELRAEI